MEGGEKQRFSRCLAGGVGSPAASGEGGGAGKRRGFGSEPAQRLGDWVCGFARLRHQVVRIWVQQGGVGSGRGFCDGIEVVSGGVRTGRGQRVCLPSGIIVGPGGRHGFALLVE